MSGIDLTMVSIIITSFSAGSLLSQIPLGMMSDKYGRRKVLLFILFSGFLIFLSAGFLNGSSIGLLLCFLFSGVMVGSTFSLGISYMADLLPRNLLPTGNLLCGISFSLGSISGPFIGGLVIQFLKGGSFFFVISLMLLLIFLAIAFFKEQTGDYGQLGTVSAHKNG